MVKMMSRILKDGKGLASVSFQWDPTAFAFPNSEASPCASTALSLCLPVSPMVRHISFLKPKTGWVQNQRSAFFFFWYNSMPKKFHESIPSEETHGENFDQLKKTYIIQDRRKTCWDTGEMARCWEFHGVNHRVRRRAFQYVSHLMTGWLSHAQQTHKYMIHYAY